MATTFSLYALFIFFFLSCLSSINTTAANSKHPQFAFDLIHRDSPLSPLYNSDSTFLDKIERLYESSIARYASVASNISGKYRIDVNVDNYFYLAKLSIGEPDIDVFVVMDTGSDLLWIQCKPCDNCQPQTSPIYDRTKSKTYANVTCGTLDCELDPNMDCDSNNVCRYNNKYVDGSYSYGIIATESLVFRNPDGTVEPKNVAFGCGINNHISSQGQLGGVLGLSATEMSLVSQLGGNTRQKFSYCLGNASNPSSKGNVIIGGDAHISSQTTPFKFDNFYHVNPVEIKVGAQTLHLASGVFGPPGNVILDSGAVYTFLPPSVYKSLADAVSRRLKSFNVKPIPAPRPGLSCYNGNIGRDLNGFPIVKILFQGTSELVLDRWSIFIDDGKGRFCLAFAATGGSIKRSTIGAMAQQFHNFGFDFSTMQLSIIQSAVCAY